MGGRSGWTAYISCEDACHLRSGSGPQSLAVAFPSAGVGVDPIIGQGVGKSVAQTWPLNWDDVGGGTQTLNFANFVTMRGGEYFFAPSLTFFKNL